MNKKELVVQLAKATGLSQVKTAQVVNALFETEGNKGILVQAIEKGEKITIPGFGTFGVKQRAARVGTNPSSGKRMQIASKRYAYFKAGKLLKELVLSGSNAADEAQQ